ncbi:MAG TPA: SAM-dependent chlorinase/fluorinase [Gemmatimonadales bacterium]
MTLIALLTDFGTSDSYVAEMKGVLSTYAPTATLVDIAHDVSPGDVRAAQYLLSRTWMFFPEGTIYVAVVDAGVGTDRRVLGATRFGRYFLAPDNGLLSFLSLNATFISIPVLPEAAPTFHGRDVFAPAAGRLATGGSFESLGTAITDPVYAPLPMPLTEGDSVVGEVLHVDRFGTLISNIAGNSIEPGAAISVAGIDAGPLQRTFADVPSGHLVAFVGSGGTVEIAVRDGNATRTLGVGVGAEVRA